VFKSRFLIFAYGWPDPLRAVLPRPRGLPPTILGESSFDQVKRRLHTSEQKPSSAALT